MLISDLKTDFVIQPKKFSISPAIPTELKVLGG